MIQHWKAPATAPGGKKVIYFSSYDGSFSAVSYAYASQFYDASSFYHKAFVYKDFLLTIRLIISSSFIVKNGCVHPIPFQSPDSLPVVSTSYTIQ